MLRQHCIVVPRERISPNDEVQQATSNIKLKSRLRLSTTAAAATALQVFSGVTDRTKSRHGGGG